MIILGRRGPAQASFTNPELRELGEMTGVDVQVDPAEVDVEVPEDVTPTVRRNVEILQGYAARAPGSAGRRITLKFLRSPVEILGEGDDGPVTGIRVVAQPARERPRGADRRAGGDRLRARAALDRLPRAADRGRAVGRAGAG